MLWIIIDDNHHHFLFVLVYHIQEYSYPLPLCIVSFTSILDFKIFKSITTNPSEYVYTLIPVIIILHLIIFFYITFNWLKSMLYFHQCNFFSVWSSSYESLLHINFSLELVILITLMKPFNIYNCIYKWNVKFILESLIEKIFFYFILYVFQVEYWIFSIVSTMNLKWYEVTYI